MDLSPKHVYLQYLRRTRPDWKKLAHLHLELSTLSNAPNISQADRDSHMERMEALRMYEKELRLIELLEG
jgi:hypothetical protein